MKYAVIGSGPCGSLAAILLLKAGHSVTLYDVDSQIPIVEVGLEYRLKLFDGSSAPYDVQQLLETYQDDSPVGLYRSKTLGGFSNVWGATWGPQRALNNSDWAKHHKLVTDLLLNEGFLGKTSNACCNCFVDLENSMGEISRILEIRIQNSVLALNPNNCACIHLGFSSCSQGGVWNSKSLIQMCQAFDKFSLKTGKDVIKIEKSHSGLMLIGESFFDQFDSVILAAGTVGTVEILLNSLPDIPFLTLNDTRMAFLPLFRMGARAEHEGGFAFSQYSMDASFGKKKLAVHIQLYSDSEIYRERIIGKIPNYLGSITRPLLSYLLPHLAIAIIYIDSNASPQVQFRKSEAARRLDVYYLSPAFSKRGLKKRLWAIFRKLKFLPMLPLISWSNPGESYHLGALEEAILDEFGSVALLPGLHVAGAISLPQIEPGPITHSAMAQTSRLIERLTTKI